MLLPWRVPLPGTDARVVSPDGKHLASSSADRSVAVYTVPDLTQVHTYPEPDWVYGLQFSPDATKLAVAPFSSGGIAILGL